MPDLDKQMNDISSLRVKVTRDLEKLSAMCLQVSTQLNQKFRNSFVVRKGSVDGMEDLYILNNIMKKNSMSARSALAVLKRMRSTGGYDVPTEEDLESKAELEELFKE